MILVLFQQVLSRVETDHMVHPEVEGLKFDIETCQQGDEAVGADMSFRNVPNLRCLVTHSFLIYR